MADSALLAFLHSWPLWQPFPPCAPPGYLTCPSTSLWQPSPPHPIAHEHTCIVTYMKTNTSPNIPMWLLHHLAGHLGDFLVLIWTSSCQLAAPLLTKWRLTSPNCPIGIISLYWVGIIINQSHISKVSKSSRCDRDRDTGTHRPDPRDTWVR